MDVTAVEAICPGLFTANTASASFLSAYSNIENERTAGWRYPTITERSFTEVRL